MIPKNLIVTKYTQGGELLRTDDYSSYQGYYYEYNGRIFTGKEYSLNSVELIKTGNENNNTLLTNPSTFTYGAISGVNVPTNRSITSLPTDTTKAISNRSIRFFYKKYNDNVIKETDKNGYKLLQNNPIYQTTFIGGYNGIVQNIDQANQQVPGVKDFLAA
jgi:hypothetical protein